MSPHKEISFETEVCEHLADHGCLYADGDAERYDRTRVLFSTSITDQIDVRFNGVSPAPTGEKHGRSH